MKLTTKKWIGGFIIGLALGGVVMHIVDANRFINKSLSLKERIAQLIPNTELKAYCPYSVDIEKAYKSGGLIKN